jgi:hypothetical protein
MTPHSQILFLVIIIFLGIYVYSQGKVAMLSALFTVNPSFDIHKNTNYHEKQKVV